MTPTVASTSLTSRINVCVCVCVVILFILDVRFVDIPAGVTREECVCVCVVIPFILDVDIPAGVTQEEGHKGFLHPSSAMLALIFLARRIPPFVSLVDRKVEFCVLTI